MPHYRWRSHQGQDWTHIEAVDANTAKAEIPDGVMLEIRAETRSEMWVKVAGIPDRIVGSGNSISVRAPDGTIYSSTSAAARELKMKYSTIRWLVSGQRGGWGRA